MCLYEVLRMRLLDKTQHLRSESKRVHLHVCMYVCMCAGWNTTSAQRIKKVHLHAYMYGYMYVYIYVYMFVYMYVCMYEFMYAGRNTTLAQRIKKVHLHVCVYVKNWFCEPSVPGLHFWAWNMCCSCRNCVSLLSGGRLRSYKFPLGCIDFLDQHSTNHACCLHLGFMEVDHNNNNIDRYDNELSGIRIMRPCSPSCELQIVLEFRMRCPQTTKIVNWNVESDLADVSCSYTPYVCNKRGGNELECAVATSEVMMGVISSFCCNGSKSLSLA